MGNLMKSIEWSDELVIGNLIVDRQHKMLVQLTNKFLDTNRAGMAKSEITRLFDELIAYTVKHFADEEELFKYTAYPDTDFHIREHYELIKSIGRLREDSDIGKRFMSFTVLRFLRYWLQKHIVEMDMKIAEYI